ncbi:MAG: class I SAM-dependent methyltransferase [Desulfuromonadales bacterium]|nr:class I SAM-dependent methyltransferase [Desulfuromonadales bacterium]
MSSDPAIHWTENGGGRVARWRSQSGFSPPRRILIGRDDMKADVAYRLACEGTTILWRGDFQNARQMLSALARRVKSKPKKQTSSAEMAPAQAFHLYRMAQAQRARTLGMLVLPFEADHSIPLSRAPDVQQPCLEAFGPADGPYIASLRDLLGAIGAHEWRKKGVEIPALGDRIHPHYGVFSPVRGEYVDLLAQAPLPSLERAFDIGTGTGVLAAVLARRGLKRVLATDLDPRALACARDNIARLGLAERVDVFQADLFPTGRAPLVVCNPPWIPARPSSSLDQAVYDPDSRMLRGFLQGLGAHLEPGGEGWLILSDLAEHLGLRSRAELLAAFEEGGLKVVDRIDARPAHRKAFDPSDPLHLARSAEVTSLWRLTG